MEVEKILEEIKKVCKAPTKYFLGCVKDEKTESQYLLP